MSGSLTQFGIGIETTYGTAVAPTKFFEITKEDFKGKYERIQADALSAAYVDRSDRWALNPKGAGGSVELEVLTKNFGNWLKFLMGTVNTTGPAETTAYTHTGTIGNLTGKYFTAQVGRAQTDGTVKPWTYEGGKVTDFEFSNAIDQTLKCNISCDFENEQAPTSPAGAYVLATNVPAVGAEILTWQGGTITVGGSTVDMSDFSVKVDNALKTDRFYIGSAANKKEPNQDGKRKVTWSFKTPYDNASFWQKVSSATLSGSQATIVAKWSGLTLLGTTIYPNITITIPYARFDEGGPNVEGQGLLEQSMSGVGLYDGTNSAITVAYQTADTTVL